MNLRTFFGRKKKPTINSVDCDTFNWELVEANEYKKAWVNGDQTAAVTLHFFDRPPDIPANLNNIDLIRSFYRNSIVEGAGGGLVRCEVVKLFGYEAIEFIFKQPGESGGMIYVGSFTIPFKKYSFVVKVQAIEAGVTGMREAMTMDKWIKKNGTPKIDANGKMEGFASDPYDEDYTKGSLMNFSEKEEFDNDFPDHPLTVVRSRMKEIKASISFRDEMSKLEGF